MEEVELWYFKAGAVNIRMTIEKRPRQALEWDSRDALWISAAAETANPFFLRTDGQLNTDCKGPEVDASQLQKSCFV